MLDQQAVHQNSRLGLILIKRQYIKAEQLEVALNFQLKRQIRLGEALVELGFINVKQLNRALRRQNWTRSVTAGVALVLTPFSPAFAASQGVAGSSSTASAQISVTIAPRSVTSGADNLVFSKNNSNIAESERICTDNLGADIYRVSVVGSGNNGKFSLTDENAYKLNYQVAYQHQAQLAEPLDFGKQSRNFQNASNNGFCGQSALNRLRVSLPPNSGQLTSNFSGYMTLTIVPE